MREWQQQAESRSHFGESEDFLCDCCFGEREKEDESHVVKSDDHDDQEQYEKRLELKVSIPNIDANNNDLKEIKEEEEEEDEKLDPNASWLL